MAIWDSPSPQMSGSITNNNSNTYFKIVKGWDCCFIFWFVWFLVDLCCLFSPLAWGGKKKQFYWHTREIFNEGNRVKSVKRNTSSISYLQKDVENLLISKSKIIYAPSFPAFPFLRGQRVKYCIHCT